MTAHTPPADGDGSIARDTNGAGGALPERPGDEFDARTGTDDDGELPPVPVEKIAARIGARSPLTDTDPETEGGA